MRGIKRRRATLGLAAFVLAATFAVGAIAGTSRTQEGPAYKKAGAWGKLGTGNGQFGNNAFGLATGKNGDVYVADSDNHRIQVFSAKGGFKGKFAFDQSESVQDVAADPDGSVWGTAQQVGEARNFGGSGDTLSVAAGGAVGIAVDAEGNVYVSSNINNQRKVTRFDKGAGGLTEGKTYGGLGDPGDVETSPDGSFYVVDGLTVKRFVGDKVAKVFKGGASKPIGIAVDLDCNLWMTNVSQRNLTRFSPTGKMLGTATSGDLIAQDVAVGPKGDLYAYDAGTRSIVRFAEDRSKPQAAAVGGAVTVSKGVAKVKYTLSGVACPAQVAGVASLKGSVNGKAAVKVAAGKSTVLSIPAKGKSGTAQFTIVLKTNGRPTTQTKAVNVSVR